VTIKSGKQCSCVEKRLHDVSELKLTCNMSCSRLTKFTPVTGVNVCDLVFVPEMDLFSTGFNFQTIFQVDGL